AWRRGSRPSGAGNERGRDQPAPGRSCAARTMLPLLHVSERLAAFPEHGSMRLSARQAGCPDPYIHRRCASRHPVMTSECTCEDLPLTGGVSVDLELSLDQRASSARKDLPQVGITKQTFYRACERQWIT